MKRLNERSSGAPVGAVDPEVVERCKRGDEDAWKVLVEATYRDVYTLCLRILRDPDDAADATQEAYVKAWKGLRSFRGDAQLSTWLYRVASNAAISKHRSRKRRRSHETRSEDQQLGDIASSTSTEQTAGARIELVRLEAALARLPNHYRDAIVLKDVYDLSVHEIARRLSISETAAKVRIHRGRKRLKEIWLEGDEREV